MFKVNIRNQSANEIREWGIITAVKKYNNFE